MGTQKIKCVAWDLDHTIWDGVLLEDKEVTVKDDIVEIIKTLDERGILQSICSKNEFETAKKKLEELQLWDYFIYPQINWNGKSTGIEQISKSINIGIDTLAFIDDQQYEREEVNFTHPEVLCIDPLESDKILVIDRMNPKYITADSKNRRKMYQNDNARNHVEEEFTGTKEEFLKTLDIVFQIRRATEDDLQRAEELTVRTHQLNSTGYVYSYEELAQFITSDQYEVLVTQLDDKFGSYGTIGLALTEKNDKIWELKLLLMSCRVMAKGVGNVFMNHIMNTARKEGASLRAQFVPTDRNRIMYITYKFNGYKEIEQNGDLVTFEADLSYERKIPEYITVKFEEGV